MPVICAAVIGPANNPLYLEAFYVENQEEALKFHYIVHCALDAVEEKVSAKRAPGEVAPDCYLGMLYPTEDYKVYGYFSNTRTRFILVVQEPAPKDEDMRSMFKRFHLAYIDVTSNPFYQMGQPIDSQQFDASVSCPDATSCVLLPASNSPCTAD